jgi:hypothetical protein
MIKNITIGLLCGLSGVGAWATAEFLGVDRPWSYFAAVFWSIGVASCLTYALATEGEL